jgi:hypothetical protein
LNPKKYLYPNNFIVLPNFGKVQFFFPPSKYRREIYLFLKKIHAIHEKFKDFILEESQCCSPCSAIGRESTRPMSTNKLFNML